MFLHANNTIWNTAGTESSFLVMGIAKKEEEIGICSQKWASPINQKLYNKKSSQFWRTKIK